MSALFTLLDWIGTRAILIVFITTFMFIWLFFRNRQSTGKLPPGPTSWPLIGSLPGILTEYFQLGRPDPHEFLASIAKKYGKFYGFKVGAQLVVVANDYHTIKEAGGNHCTAARPEQIQDAVGGDGKSSKIKKKKKTPLLPHICVKIYSAVPISLVVLVNYRVQT